MRVLKATMAMAAGLCAGCAGPMFEGTIFERPPRRDPEMARVASGVQQASFEARQVAERLDALGRSVEVLDGRVARLEAQQVSGAPAQDELAALRRDIQQLRGEREALRKEITDDLAARVERIARLQAGAPARPANAPAAAGAGSGKPAGAGPAAGRSGYEHKVERGQTLSEIARGYGKSVDAIMKANKLTNASAIRAGQVLFIPD